MDRGGNVGAPARDRRCRAENGGQAAHHVPLRQERGRSGRDREGARHDRSAPARPRRPRGHSDRRPDLLQAQELRHFAREDGAFDHARQRRRAAAGLAREPPQAVRRSRHHGRRRLHRARLRRPALEDLRPRLDFRPSRGALEDRQRARRSTPTIARSAPTSSATTPSPTFPRSRSSAASGCATSAPAAIATLGRPTR